MRKFVAAEGLSLVALTVVAGATHRDGVWAPSLIIKLCGVVVVRPVSMLWRCWRS